MVEVVMIVVMVVVMVAVVVVVIVAVVVVAVGDVLHGLQTTRRRLQDAVFAPRT